MTHALRLSGLFIVCECGATFAGQRQAAAHLRAAPREDQDRERLEYLSEPRTTAEVAERWGASRAAALTALKRMEQGRLVERRWNTQPPFGCIWRTASAGKGDP